MTNIDDVAQTLAEYERLAITSGAKVQIDPPEFSDGLSITPWQPFWLGEHPPKVARATVHRDDVATVVYVVWDESLPVETAQTDDGRLWRDLWLAQPTKRFGSFALRTALRRAFREVVGDRVEPDEDAPRVATPAARDWAAEYVAATTVEQVDDIRRAARAARENTLELQDLWHQRRDELIFASVNSGDISVNRAREMHGRPSVEDAWAAFTEPAPDLSPDEHARHVAFFGPERREPQDHQPPANRAARRASARKKGSRR